MNAPECVEGRRLCKPQLLRKPSGIRFCHEWTCPDKPGEAIDIREYTKGRGGQPWRGGWRR